MSFLANPCKLWVSDRLDYKRTVLKLVFADRLYYIRNEGFRTADLSIPFKVLADLREGKSKMALPRGIELKALAVFPNPSTSAYALYFQCE
jgi:hypothetical protein